MKNLFLSGRLANFGQVTNENTNAEGKNNAFAVRFINVTLDKKDEETGYNKQAPMKVIAFGKTAERLASFEPMEHIVLSGKLDKEDDFVTDNGEMRTGSWIVKVDMIDNWSKAENERFSGGSSAHTTHAAPESKKKAPKKAPTRKARPSVKTA